MRKLILLLILVTTISLWAQCPPPKIKVQICKELNLILSKWDVLPVKDKVFVKNHVLVKYDKLNPDCLDDKQLIMFLTELQKQ
jgi:hypothetical protein